MGKLLSVKSFPNFETAGSMMNQHGGKNRHLSPKYFSMELYLKFNLGPLHLLDSLIEEVQKREPVSFVRKELNAELCSSKDIKINAAVNTNQEKKRGKITIFSRLLFKHQKISHIDGCKKL